MTDSAITIEQLIDLVNQDLTVSGLLPKILPEMEILRIIKEHSLEWFYKNYQFAVQKGCFVLRKENLTTQQFIQFNYFILPEEIENVTNVKMINDPSVFKLGIQAPHLSINLGVTNQPYLTSFVSTAGDLAVYKSVVGAFADEINKMVLESVKYDYNPVNNRINFLSGVKTDLILEVNIRIEQEELFGLQLFKDYVIGQSRKKLGETLQRFTNLVLPGEFQYDPAALVTQGNELIESVTKKVEGITQTGWFIMSR